MFWKELQAKLGTRLKFSTTSHPQTDGQRERTIQTLEDMLRVSTLDFLGSWAEKLPLIEFAYNNSYHQSLKMSHSKLYTEENVGHLSIGMKPGREDF